jgi:hypothetical protein
MEEATRAIICELKERRDAAKRNKTRWYHEWKQTPNGKENLERKNRKRRKDRREKRKKLEQMKKTIKE